MSRNKLVGILFISLFFFTCQDARFKQGAGLYEFYCSSCHMADGTGLAQLYPPLNKSDWLEENLSQLPYIMRYGIEDTLYVNGHEYTIPMSGLPELSAVEISNITNYILSAWENDLGKMSFKEVQNSLVKKED